MLHKDQTEEFGYAVMVQLLGTWMLNNCPFSIGPTFCLQGKVWTTINSLVLNKIIAIQQYTEHARGWPFGSEREFSLYLG